MRYTSTRGGAPELGFADVLLGGLAPDGGLYVPTGWPRLAPGWDRPRPYAELALEVITPFVDDDVTPIDLAAMVADAYAAFDHPDVVPLVELEPGLHVLELFHGPTLAFKDVALQLVGRLFDHELARRGERATIVVATSGDTGSAAIEACRDRTALDIVVLHPAGRVSDVQRRLMTTVDEPNVHNVAVEGTFDDCQDLVKAMFADVAFRRRMHLSAMNSINWARVMPQIAYYVAAGAKLGRCSFTVPTGNFGSIYSGWVAEQMGLPIEQLVIATNANDILARWVERGDLVAEEVVPTLSPAMDIQISSNHERLLWELLGRDGAKVAELLDRFRSVGSVEAPVDPRFDATPVTDVEALATIEGVHRSTGMLVDPHTAVGITAARRVRRSTEVPMVCLATAHPAKFPEPIEQATGVRPPLPEHLADLLDRPERYEVLPADLAALTAHVERCASAG